MATAWIREYRDVGVAGAGRPLPVPAEPGTDQTLVTFSGSVQSAAFAANTKYIAICATAAFHYVVAMNPTATTNALKCPADVVFHISVPAGYKIAFIAAA